MWRRAVILEHPVVPLLGRLMMAYIFATSGMGKVFGWSGNVGYLSTRHLPLIPVLLAIAMLIEVAGSVCLVTGYQARIAAFVMFCYTTAVTSVVPQLLGVERNDGGSWVVGDQPYVSIHLMGADGYASAKKSA